MTVRRPAQAARRGTAPGLRSASRPARRAPGRGAAAGRRPARAVRPPSPAEFALTKEPLYEGEPILAVAADSEEIAADAIEKIIVDFEPLPFVIDPLDSAAARRTQRPHRRQRVRRRRT